MRKLNADVLENDAWRLWEEASETEIFEKTFDTLADLIQYVKGLPGDVQVLDWNTHGSVALQSGKVIHVGSEYGGHDGYLERHWMYGGVPQEEKENIRYSIYDVYSERELL